MSKEFTYADAGVNRRLRAKSKEALKIFEETFKFSRYGNAVQLPYGNVFPFRDNCYLDFVIEEIGTKVLVAQLAERYDTIGVDGVAMAVNDVIRSGAKPFAIADNIHTQVSDPILVKELIRGIAQGAAEAECIVPSGEIGDVAELIKSTVEGKGFDIIIAAIGDVTREKMVTGRDIKTGDAIIGIRSSGLHSNGVSFARKILFKQWGGKYTPHDVPEGLERAILYEVLEPTRIYVKPFLRVAEELKVKAAVHITGDAYLKFDRLTKFSKGIGFEFDNFSPQPIFELIRKTASELGYKVTDEEMFKTFNMGWGFAIIVDKADEDDALDALEKTAVHAERIGCVTSSERIKIMYGRRKIVLK